MSEDELMQQEIDNEITNWLNDPTPKTLKVVIDGTTIIFHKMAEILAA